MTTKEIFSQRLKELREARRIPQKQVVQESGITAYTCYENGICSPQIGNLVVLAKYYGVSADYLLGLTNDESAAEPLTVAVGKQTPKVPWLSDEDYWCCPICNAEIVHEEDLFCEIPYCSQCGQKLNWKILLRRSSV